MAMRPSRTLSTTGEGGILRSLLEKDASKAVSNSAKKSEILTCIDADLICLKGS
jgi:hypothetical protein